MMMRDICMKACPGTPGRDLRPDMHCCGMAAGWKRKARSEARTFSRQPGLKLNREANDESPSLLPTPAAS